MKLEDLSGKCHAHITIAANYKTIQPPKGWKFTIIVLNNQVKTQEDVIITRHYLIGGKKHKSAESIIDELHQVADVIRNSGIEVLRVKLEHESLPTLPITKKHYRECHFKLEHSDSLDILSIPGLEISQNVVENSGINKVTFLTARYYAGCLENIGLHVRASAKLLQELNPNATLKSIHEETIILDTNPDMDSWWLS